MKDNIHSLYDERRRILNEIRSTCQTWHDLNDPDPDPDPLLPHLGAFLAMILSVCLILGLLWMVLVETGVG